MDTEEKLELTIKALEKIRDFDHTDNCISYVPIHECGCYYKDQWQIAREALDEID